MTLCLLKLYIIMAWHVSVLYRAIFISCCTNVLDIKDCADWRLTLQIQDIHGSPPYIQTNCTVLCQNKTLSVCCTTYPISHHHSVFLTVCINEISVNKPQTINTPVIMLYSKFSLRKRSLYPGSHMLQCCYFFIAGEYLCTIIS
jgi:hypothetical protein